MNQIRQRVYRRRRVSRADIAAGLADFYRDQADTYRQYGAGVEGEQVITSIFTRPDWLDLGLTLGRGDDHVDLDTQAPVEASQPDEMSADAAAQRLAETLATNTRFVNKPLYQLVDIDLSRGPGRALLSRGSGVRRARS